MPITLAEIVRRLHDRASPRATVPTVSDTMRRFIQAFVPRTATDILDDWFPWTRDQRLAMDPNVPDDERMAALDRVVAVIRWAPNPTWSEREQRAWRELRDRAGDEQRSVAELKQELLKEAVLLVLGDRERFRRVRVGSGPGSFWLREDDDAAVGVRPLDLPSSADRDVAGGAGGLFAESPYLYWFHREVQAAATAILLGEPYPPTDAAHEDAWERPRDSIDDGLALDAEAETDPLLKVLDAEHHREASRQLAAIMRQATPRQQDLIALIADGATVAEAAYALGIRESTVRVQLKRLRDKAKAM